jgi:chromosome segregation ATPase
MPRSEAARSHARWLAAALLCAVPLTAAAQQQSQQDVAQALARAQMLLRQVAQERSQLEAEATKLRAEKAALDKQVAAGKSRLKELQAELESNRRDNASLEKRLAGAKERTARTEIRLKEAIAEYRSTLAQLQSTEAARAEFLATSRARAAEIERCEANNTLLYQANLELLERYRDKGLADAWLQSEPFTGIKQVEIENVLEEYRCKLEDMRYERAAAPASADTAQE